MRQREAESQQRQFRYTLIRIKFPDGPILQGTFKVNETLQDVRLFVQEALEDPSCEFQLRFPSGMVTNYHYYSLKIDYVVYNSFLVYNYQFMFRNLPPCNWF